MSVNDKAFATRMREDEMLHNFGQVLKTPDVKPLMLKLIVSNIFKVIEINRDQVNEENFNKSLHKKFKAFEWPLKPYMERIKASDKYINVLKYEKPRCLSNFKFLSDLNHLRGYLREILSCRTRALDSLRDCQRKFTYKDKLALELKNNTKILANKNNELEQLLNLKQNEQRILKDRFNAFADSVMDEVLIIDPAIIRYRTKVLKGQSEEFKDKLVAKRIALEKAIKDYARRIVVTENAHELTVEHLKVEIQNLRHKVRYWTKKFEEEYDKYSTKNTGLKLNVKAMESNHETLHRRLQEFRTTLIRLDMVREKKKLQEEMLAKEMAELKKKSRLRKMPIKIPIKMPKKKKDIAAF